MWKKLRVALPVKCRTIFLEKTHICGKQPGNRAFRQTRPEAVHRRCTRSLEKSYELRLQNNDKRSLWITIYSALLCDGPASRRCTRTRKLEAQCGDSGASRPG